VWKPKNLTKLQNLKNLKFAKTEKPVFPRVFEFFRNLENLKKLKIEIFEIFKIYNYNLSYNLSIKQLLAEFDSDDVSVGRFVNQSVTNGTLNLLAE